tara:strand:+ start:447 stop:1283 length:837 start_codon:yes stop_codon:yes gene_type:complete
LSTSFTFPYQEYTLKLNQDQSYTTTPKINEPLKRKFDMVFSSLKGKKRTIKSSSGDLNIRSLIDWEIAQKDQRIFDRDIRSKGGTVILLVDGSGSMRYHQKMTETRNLVATLYKSLDGISKITFKVIMYFGCFRTDEQQLGIIEINSLEECNKLVTDSIDDFGSTPTASAMHYCTKLLKKVRGKKLVITMTDGHPTIFNATYNSGNGIPDSKSQQFEQTRLSYLEADNQKIKNFGIGIQVGGDHMAKMFRRNFVEVNDIESSQQPIIKQLQMFVKSVK